MPDDGRPRRVYVANHPPLFYAIAALPLGLGEWFGTPRAGFLAARLLSAALAAGGLVMVAWLALVWSLTGPGWPSARPGWRRCCRACRTFRRSSTTTGSGSWPPAPPWSRRPLSSGAARPRHDWPGWALPRPLAP